MNDFPFLQKKIILYKIDDPLMTFDTWIEHVLIDLQIKLTPLTLTRFILKTALGYHWEHSDVGGRNPFLCPTDLELLKNEIEILVRGQSDFIEQSQFIEFSINLKSDRLFNASKFLNFINCKRLAKKIADIEPVEPCRQWICSTASSLGFTLSSVFTIDPERYYCSSADLLVRFYETYEKLITSCPPQLIFGADETMIDSDFKNKVIALKMHGTLLKVNIDVPHITAMCCHSVIGKAVPLFIILPNSIQNLPEELIEFKDGGLAWFSSSQSGWMTKDLFLIWVINFINFLGEYRKSLDKSIRNKRALLIMDGHGSRQCPIAIQLLETNLIDVLILPEHSTHVTQMFDVALAYPLKQCYSKNFQKLLKNIDFNNLTISKIAEIRKIAVSSIVSAWSATCTYLACKKAAEVTGFVPFNKDKVRESKYAIQRTPEEDNEYQIKKSKRNRLDINSNILNRMIDQIDDLVRDHPKFNYLATNIKIDTWKDVLKNYAKKKLPNDCFYLGGLVPYSLN